jgi:AraC-like DNA-binding protein
MVGAGSFGAVGRVDFAETKYGRQLLVDAAMTSRLAEFDCRGRPHALTFFDLLLVTHGRGTFWLDGERHDVAPGQVFFTRPGQIRQWQAERLEGACLFFSRRFVEDAFSDPRFLNQFSYFRRQRPAAVLTLGRSQRQRFLDRFRVMTHEIGRNEPGAPHVLRAILYELLALLDRWYVARYGTAGASAPQDELLWRFEALMEERFSTQQRLAEYARELGVTPGHLSARCRRQLGSPAGELIRQRVALEARRLLLYDGATVAEIGYRLGFVDPSYFTRFFRRETGLSPSRFRTVERHHL